MRRGPTGDAGFTLVEVLAAGTLSIALALPALAMLRFTYRIADTLQTRAAVSAQARQVFALLGNGTTPISAANPAVGARGFNMVEGLRSRTVGTSGLSNPLPAGASLRSVGQFVLIDGSGSKALQVTGDAVPTLNIPCTAVGTPMPDCTGAGTSVTAKGWLGRDPVITTSTFGTSYNGSTLSTAATVVLTISNPLRAMRIGSRGRIGLCTVPATAATVVQGCVSEQFRTMFAVNAEAAP